MNILLCGGAGFIGSHLADRLVLEGNKVIAVDNLSLGKEDNIKHLFENGNFNFIKADLADFSETFRVFETNNIDAVYHLAANSDIKQSSGKPQIECTNTFLSTYNILECMRLFNVKKLFFSSTSAVYGENPDKALNENSGPFSPISYYGAAKLASEAFISAFTFMNDFNTIVLRFPNVIGSRLTHGVIYDFIKKLKKNPSKLEILGDGTQTKPYLHVSDLVEAIILAMSRASKGVNCFNVGVESHTSVKGIADMVCSKMGFENVQYVFSGGSVGWKGDVPRFKYDLTKIYSIGWKARFTSDEAVLKTLEEVIDNESGNNGRW